MPRAGLSTRTVIDAAAQLLDDEGEEGLSIASLAQRLGVRPPSLYKHIDGMSGLRRSVMLGAKGDLAQHLGRAAIGKARDDAIRAMALAYRQWAKAHPAQYPMTMRAPVPGDDDDQEVSAALVDVIYTILAGYRIDDDDDLVDATRLLRSALHGFVDLETTDAFQLPRDLERSFERLIDNITVALAGWTRS